MSSRRYVAGGALWLLLSVSVALILLAPRSVCSTPATPFARRRRPDSDEPHLHGIFLDLTSTTQRWGETEWRQDLQAMVDVGIRFFVLHHVAVGSSEVTGVCPLGNCCWAFHIPQ
eukprot:SAG31_NODE_6332_length_2062_cov_1.602649_4_plen_115_part_00